MMLTIEILYSALPHSIQRRLQIKEGSTVLQALTASGLLEEYPVIHDLAWGIFSKRVTGDTMVSEGDRIEIYRGLTNHPMEKRRQRAR